MLFYLWILTLIPNSISFLRWLDPVKQKSLSSDQITLIALEVFYIFPWFLLLYFIFRCLQFILRKNIINQLLFIGFASAAITDSFYRFYLYRPINLEFWPLLLETSFYEKWNYLNELRTPLLAILCLAMYVIFFRQRTHSNNNHKKYRRLHRFDFYALILSLTFILGLSQFSGKSFSQDSGEMIAEATQGPTEATRYLFPFNWLYSYSVYSSEQKTIEKIAQQRRQKSTLYSATAPQPVLVFLVIGESSTSSHWGLNHYQKQTTPQLAAQKNLYFFSKIQSLAANTRTAVPLLLRLYTQKDAKYIYQDPSIIQAYKANGYTTHWISMQGQNGKFDDTIRSLSIDSDFEKFLNPMSFESENKFDQELFSELPDLKNLNGKHLFILHTLGSHMSYQHRYPDSFQVFKPVLGKNEYAKIFRSTPEHLQKIINSYDNSILYTDWFLSQLIERLEKSNKTSVLGYISDHGQALDDNTCRFIGHDDSCLSELHVPMLYWISPSFAPRQTDKLKYLIDNKDQVAYSNSFAMTLLDLSGISYQGRLLSLLLSSKQK